MTATMRPATRHDVAAIVALLADDVLGAGRGTDELAPYLAAFDRIDRDPSELLVVADDVVVETMQLSVLPGPSRSVTRL